MTRTAKATIGAVAYDPKVVTIWEGIREHLIDHGLQAEVALYSSYERQVEALLAGHVEIAWNTPLAHVRVRRRTERTSRSLAMRDTDRGVRTKILVRRDAGIAAIGELAGKRLAVGSRDSTQARILPLHFLAKSNVDVQRIQLVPFDTDVGKHGDTGTSELEVVRAVEDGRADAGAVGDVVWAALQSAGQLKSDLVDVLWTSPPFDHCMFDALAELPQSTVDTFTRALFAMSWNEPNHRRLLELEGLKQWVAPRETGYDTLWAALDEQRAW